MKTISLHGVDKELELKIREKAGQYGLSLNKTLKKIIGDSLGGTSGSMEPRRDFDDLCGALSAEEGGDLAQVLAEMDRVDPENWR